MIYFVIYLSEVYRNPFNSPLSVTVLVYYLAIISLVAEGGGNAVLDGFDPGLSQLL